MLVRVADGAHWAYGLTGRARLHDDGHTAWVEIFDREPPREQGAFYGCDLTRCRVIGMARLDTWQVEIAKLEKGAKGES